MPAPSPSTAPPRSPTTTCSRRPPQNPPPYPTFAASLVGASIFGPLISANLSRDQRGKLPSFAPVSPRNPRALRVQVAARLRIAGTHVALASRTPFGIFFSVRDLDLFRFTNPVRDLPVFGYCTKRARTVYLSAPSACGTKQICPEAKTPAL